jgi:hypothetical protein
MGMRVGKKRESKRKLQWRVERYLQIRRKMERQRRSNV